MGNRGVTFYENYLEIGEVAFTKFGNIHFACMAGEWPEDVYKAENDFMNVESCLILFV